MEGNGRNSCGGKSRHTNIIYFFIKYALKREEIELIHSPTEIADLLNNTTVTSSDFNTIKALVQGEIDSFMGFKFHVSNRLVDNGAANTQCIAFAEDGILLGVGKDVTARIDERSDKSYATQVYYCQTIGATRMEEAKVVSVLAN